MESKEKAAREAGTIQGDGWSQKKRRPERLVQYREMDGVKRKGGQRGWYNTGRWMESKEKAAREAGTIQGEGWSQKKRRPERLVQYREKDGVKRKGGQRGWYNTGRRMESKEKAAREAGTIQ